MLKRLRKKSGEQRARDRAAAPAGGDRAVERAACGVSKMSDMKLQNTDTAKRLNTLSQMKKTRGESQTENRSRFSTKNP